MQRRILIVDDQTDILRILQREFRRRSDYFVATANSPEEALTQMGQQAADLVISDVRLGPTTGFSLVEALNQAHPGTGTILMTAYRSPAYRQQAEALGVSYFLEKPFPVHTLVEAADRFFSQRTQARQEEAIEAEIAAPDPTATSALVHFKPEDLVQLFCLNGRNVRITLNFDTKHPPGFIYIQKGRVVTAELGVKRGEEAFFALFALPEPTLALENWPTPIEPTITASWEYLLLEVARLQDTTVHAEPLPEPLAEPFAEFWSVAQMPPLVKK